MKIMIADSRPLFVEGLSNLLESEDFIISGIASDGQRAVAEALETRPDVILMGVDIPVIDGIEAARLIKKGLPKVRIFLLADYQEEDGLQKALQAGASGYLLRSLDGEELITTIS